MKKNEYEMERNVIYNAIVNANRKKNSRIIPLFNESAERVTEDVLNDRKELFGS
ncbi:hypothetical protein LC087_12435 [Bacillus carboniphilus]|uniref:Uncharacterized protein n=1 Tax=Bacillus carboniphilus TaxID=86663 RepID=A0ABY9JVG4_9BACI|nr:hypothetical protein [Bacillus carboniphilus]WLR41671.1 hypothetical protein LC087_12435 [Bacillus carboniphilus]